MVAFSVCQPCSGNYGPLGRDKPQHCYGSSDRPAPKGVFGGFRCKCECRNWTPERRKAEERRV